MEMIKQLLTVFIPLVIIVDPLGNLPFSLLFTKDSSSREQRRIAFVATLTAGLILFVFSLTGDFVLKFFGISIPSFQIAGGFIFFIYVLQMLGLIPSGVKTSAEEEREGWKRRMSPLCPWQPPCLQVPGP